MNRKTTKNLAFAAIVASLGLVLAMPAQAALKLKLTQGASTVTIQDQGAGDTNPIVGEVTFVGTVGTFVSNISTGFSKPAVGAAAAPIMDVSTGNRGGPGTLVIELTDTDFTTSGPTQFAMNIGGTIGSGAAGNSVQYDAYFDAGNGEFAQGGLINTVGPFVGTGAFSGAAGGAGPAAGPYSLTQVLTIIHNGSNILTSFDAELRQVPEPGTLALFGMSMLGFGLAVRRRVSRQA